jgi:hypothetical protein
MCAEINHGLKPHSFELARHQTVDLNVKLQEEKRTVHNVIGYLPGRTSEELIMIIWDWVNRIRLRPLSPEPSVRALMTILRVCPV